MKRFSIGAVALALGCAFVGAGCNNPSYNRATVVEDLREQTELTGAQADCLSKRLEQSFEVRRLGARDEPTPSERDKFHAALLYAIVACSGRPYDRARVTSALEHELRMSKQDATCMTREVEARVKPATLASDDNLTDDRVAEIRAAIVDATLACGGGTVDVRRNAGLTSEEAKCVLDAPARDRADEITECEDDN